MSDVFRDMPQQLSTPAPSQPLQPRALYEALADRVRVRILSHELKPGDPVDEVVLVNDYGVSRTPVREALKLLHHEGLLTARPRRGMCVTQLAPEGLAEAKELYRLLKAHAASRSLNGGDLLADSLLGRMLEMTERQLRLAYGPSFEAWMKDGVDAAAQ